MSRPTCGSIFSGGGLMDEAARLAGFRSLFGVEIDPRYARIWRQNHPGEMHCRSIHEMCGELPSCDLLIGGVPCEPFSNKRRNKGGNERASGTAADHPLADMVAWAVMSVRTCKPRWVVIEEAATFLDHDIGKILTTALRRLGYEVEGRVIDGLDYGSMFVRKRTVIIASADGVRWMEPTGPSGKTLRDFLVPADDPSLEWFGAGEKDEKPWLFEHWAKQSAKGNNFASAVLTPDATSLQAVSKRYFNGQGDGQVVAHPSRPGVFRWLTLDEVRRLTGLRPDYDLGPAKTVAGHVLGQGVLVDVFEKVIRGVAGYAN